MRVFSGLCKINKLQPHENSKIRFGSARTVPESWRLTTKKYFPIHSKGMCNRCRLSNGRCQLSVNWPIIGAPLSNRPQLCSQGMWSGQIRRLAGQTLIAWLKQLMAAWRCSLKCGKWSCDNESLAAANDLADAVRALASETLFVSVCSHLHNKLPDWFHSTPKADMLRNDRLVMSPASAKSKSITVQSESKFKSKIKPT